MKKKNTMMCMGVLLALVLAGPAFAGAAEHPHPNQFEGSDTERIQAAVDRAKETTGIVVIPRTNAKGGKGWLIDRAILLPSDITVVLENTTLQLSDRCRDNLFRSDNVGEGITDPGWNRNIHIVGVGRTVLRGADNPRATGDGARKLVLDPAASIREGVRRVSYGSDAADPEQKQTGDWRNIMILMAYVNGFKLSNVRIENSHAWAVSLERTHHAELRDIELHNPEDIEVDGRKVMVANKDGIDLRQGCKHFRIHNISGLTADDFIALSNLDTRPDKEQPHGNLDSTMVTSSRWHGPEDDIEHIHIGQIQCASIYRAIAIRGSDRAGVHHIYIDGLVSSEIERPGSHHNAILIGGKGYGKPSEPGKLNHIYAMNIVTSGRSPVMMEAPASDCHFMNVLYSGQEKDLIHFAIDASETRNVTWSNLRSTQAEPEE